MSRLIRYLRGSVRFRLTGAAPEQCLNALAAARLEFWDIEREDVLHLSLSVPARESERLQRLALRCLCTAEVTERSGLRAQFGGLLRRPVLLLGLLAAAAATFVLQEFVWTIEVEGNDRLPAGQIVQALEELGIAPGTWGPSIDSPETRNRMLLRMPELAWLAVNRSGGRVQVLVTERQQPPDTRAPYAVANVVAARDGVVTQVRALEGQPMVRAGDAVQTGDTLISGLVEPTREGGKYRTAHARGTVQAYTTHTVQAARPLTEQSKRYTGKIRHQYALVMGNKRLNFYIGSGITGGTCDKIITTRHFWLSDSVVLPVALVTQTYTFYEREPTTCTAEDVRVDMLSRALGETAADIDGMVTSHSETLTEQNGAAVLHLTVHAEEQIGTEAVDDSAIPEENVEMEQVP